jgi:RNA recognition motif-containing protein
MEYTIMAASKLFVGSLAYTTTNEELSTLFAEAGTVVSATIIMNRDTNQSKGFGFVEMSTEEEAQEAIKMFNGREEAGRRLTVNKANPPTDRGARPSYSNNNRY